MRRVVLGAAAHLRPGGVAQLLGNWESHETSGLERAASWVREAGVHGWLVEREVQDPARYAETWIRDGGQTATGGFEALYGAWLDDFAARGVREVGFGYLTLWRDRDGGRDRPRVRTERLLGETGENPAGLGGTIARGIAADAWLAATDDEGVLDARLTVSSDVVEERTHEPGAADPTVIVLRQGGGLGREADVETATAALVGASDGDLPVRVLAAAIAQLLDADPAEMTARLVPVVRRLVADGFLLVPGATPADTAAAQGAAG